MQVVKESIFVSAIRSFFNAFLAMIGILIGLGIIVGIGFSFSAAPMLSSDDDVVMQIMPTDSDAPPAAITDSTPVILHLDIRGVIGDAHLHGHLIEKYLRASRKGLLKNGKVKGIILEMDSPGGTVIDSDTIYRALSEYRKMYKVPIYTYVYGYCASGGYYIACASDKINASPSSVIGSVGVRIGPNFNFANVMDKYGISQTTLTQGKHKIKFPMFSNPPEGKDSSAAYKDIQNLIASYYQRFVDIVDDSRATAGLTKAQLVNNYGAQIYVGPEAEKIHYIDNGNSTYSETLSELVAECDIKEGTPYAVVRIHQRQSPLKELVTNKVDLLVAQTKEALLGIPYIGKFNSQFLYHYAATD